jgi:hypothetical protein
VVGGPTIQAWETGAESGLLGPSTELASLHKQERCSLANTDKHVDAVPDLVERVRNEILKSLSRFSQRATRMGVTSATKTPIGAATKS